MTKKTHILPKFSIVILSSLILSGCQLYNPTTESQLYPVKMHLQQTAAVETFTAENKPNLARIEGIVDNYNKTSDDVMVLQIHYAKNQSEHAIYTGSQYKKLLSESGVKNIRVEMMPRADFTSLHPEVQIRYKSWKAGAPIGCPSTKMPGHYGAELPDAVYNYKMGCDTETYISKMVVRPKDLLGNEGIADGDSRREGTIVEGYKSGTPNEPLEGVSVQDAGNGGG